MARRVNGAQRGALGANQRAVRERRRLDGIAASSTPGQGSFETRSGPKRSINAATPPHVVRVPVGQDDLLDPDAARALERLREHRQVARAAVAGVEQDALAAGARRGRCWCPAR